MTSDLMRKLDDAIERTSSGPRFFAMTLHTAAKIAGKTLAETADMVEEFDGRPAIVCPNGAFLIVLDGEPYPSFDYWKEWRARNVDQTAREEP